MGRKRPGLSPEEQALFAAAVEGVTPLHARDRLAVPPAPPSVRKPDIIPPTQKLTVEGDTTRYVARAPGVNRAELATLRAGKVHVEETLDLHGDTVERGITRLKDFLCTAVRMRRCVLVIHGKGLHSEHGAPLREAVLDQLLGPLSGFVHAFATAAPAHGGEGATYLLLRGAR